MNNYFRVKIFLLVALSACNDESTSTHKQIEVNSLSNKETIKEEPIVVKVFFNSNDSILKEYTAIDSKELFSVFENDSTHRKTGTKIKVCLYYKGYSFDVGTLGAKPRFGTINDNHFGYVEMNDSFMNYLKNVPVNNFVFEMYADQQSDVRELLDTLIKYKLTDKSDHYRMFIERNLIEVER